MLDFIRDNFKQIVLLALLVVITGYAMFMKDMSMVDKILMAILAVLDVTAITKQK